MQCKSLSTSKNIKGSVTAYLTLQLQGNVVQLQPQVSQSVLYNFQTKIPKLTSCTRKYLLKAHKVSISMLCIVKGLTRAVLRTVSTVSHSHHGDIVVDTTGYVKQCDHCTLNTIILMKQSTVAKYRD